ncbi:MAG: SOS response-associated peptidase [Candidatus Hermodarchaeota archaeon]
MCGRFTLVVNLEDLIERFGAREVFIKYTPSYNIAPSQRIAAVIQTQAGNNLIPLIWGFKLGEITAINARDDKVLQVDAFRRALREDRCIIPASGFYEWQKSGKIKIPKYIRLKSKEVFSFAGLIQEIKSTTGSVLKYGTIITTQANALVKKIHNRMPAILPKKFEDEWLNESTQSEDELIEFLQPYPPETMEAYTVSNKVSNAKNNSPDLIKPKTTLNSYF